MNLLKKTQTRLRALFHKRQLDADMDAEMRSHIELRTRENLQAGMSREEARFAALRQFGWTESIKEECRHQRGIRWLEDLAQDVCFGVRQLRKSPGFTAVAVLTLALGIGANTAIFQLIDGIRLNTLPVSKPKELALVQIADMNGARGDFNSPFPTVTNPLWEKIRDNQQSFSGIFAWSPAGFGLGSAGPKRSASGLWVSGDFFGVLGVQPALGRFFTQQEDRRGSASAVAVISHGFWQREFGGATTVVGKTLNLDGHPVEIIGVSPAGFFGLEVGRSYDVAVPVSAEPILEGGSHRLDSGTTWWLTVMGRLKPGATFGQASTDLAAISPGIFQATLPANYPAVSVTNYLGFKLSAAPAGTGVSMLREEYSKPLWLLLSIAGSLLLVACANLANLLLARANVREREFVVRLALGASRRRLIRQLMTESLLLALTGAGLGWLLGRALSRILVSFLTTAGNPLFLNLQLDWKVFLFTGGVAVLTCGLFGLMPALRGTRASAGASLREAGRGMTASRQRFGLRRALVVSQVALSLMLVVGALLFSRSLGNLMYMDAGFQQDGIMIANVDFEQLRLPMDRRVAFKRRLLERLRQVPGVEAAADASNLPLGGNYRDNMVWMDGSRAAEGKKCLFSVVGEDYFKTLRTPLLAGREFTSQDGAGAPRVAIVNESFARQVANGGDPVGKSFWIEATPSAPESRYEIAGVVKDTKYRDLREDFAPIAFLPASQERWIGEYDLVILRSKASPAGIISAAKRAIGEIDPNIDADFRVFKTGIQSSLLRERLIARLSQFFGLLALTVACVGLYGILSYGVASRTNEIGLRMALGAQRRSVLWFVLREAFLLVLIGLGAGLPLVLGMTRLISSMLFGLAPADPVSISLASFLMLVTAGVAGRVPALRASQVEPMNALRTE